LIAFFYDFTIEQLHGAWGKEFWVLYHNIMWCSEYNKQAPWYLPQGLFLRVDSLSDVYLEKRL